MSVPARAARANGRKTISISSEYLFQGSNIHDFGRYADVDLAIAADAEATLPSLIEEIRKQTTPERKSAIQARGARVAAAHKEIQLNGIRDAQARLGREPGQRAAHHRGARRSDRQRRLGDRLRPPVHRRLAAPPAESRQAVSLQRRLRRLRHRLRLPRLRRWRAGAQEVRPALGRHRRRRRSQLQPRRHLDRSAPQDPAALHRPQQPRVSRGGDDHPADVRRARTRQRRMRTSGT